MQSDNSTPLALDSKAVQARLSISRTVLQRLIREKKLTALTHIKKNYRIFAMTEILELLKSPTPNK